MRWSTYLSARDGRQHIAVVDDGVLHGLKSPASLLDLLGDDGEMLHTAAQTALADPFNVLRADEAVILAPIPVPPSIRDFMAFEDHLKPIMAARGAVIDPAWYQIPAFYFTNPAATLGPTDDVKAAPGGVFLDYELEIAAVIGSPGRDLAPDEAVSHIAGYILLSDWSARDLQQIERGIGLGPVKGKDWATTFGPVFVTADELPIAAGEPGPNIRMQASVNGRPYSDGNLTELYWSFGEMISYASRGTEIRAGDIIGSGTVGTGCIADLSARHSPEEYPWLTVGDRVHLEAGILGSIDCVITPASPVIPLRPATRS